MNPELNAWIDLALRWTHVFAGIMWVGATFYFTWLDGRFEELAKEPDKAEGEKKFVWMVHSGGFYAVEKQKVPKLMPATLHWFKWEAGITWLSGIVLFGFLYWHGKLLTSLEETAADRWKSLLPCCTAPAWLNSPLDFLTNHYLIVSFVLLLLGWAVYDLLWGKVFKNDKVGVAVSFLLVVALALFACVAFPGRGAYMQLGAMFGTIMAANVWMRILPAQRRMVAALKAGQPANTAEGARAKTRSKHNTFIIFPVVFIMISNHYSNTYGSAHNWLILSAMVLVGWGVALIIRRA
ncbi:MAG: hypothetical protein EPO07_12680 [Verrucomicrobia bacterium]|nr:MAG: hypothetical protein EPO07_12680 [Verrucomicrobiota bacterium]